MDARHRSRAPDECASVRAVGNSNNSSADAFYRSALQQLQSEFTRAVEALEKQVAGLSAHNALLETAQQQQQTELATLQHELDATRNERQREQQQAHDAISSLTNELALAREDAQSQFVAAAARERALQTESNALAELLQQEQRYWRRFESAKQRELETLHAQLATLRADCTQHCLQRDNLQRELAPLQMRVDAATRASRQLEQRLAALASDARDTKRTLEARVTKLQRKLRDAHEQNALLADALADCRDQQQSPKVGGEWHWRHASDTSALSDPTTVDTATVTTAAARSSSKTAGAARKRDVAPSQSVAAKRRASPSTTTNALDRSLALESHAPTSPTASSPDLTPPSTPRKRESTRRDGVQRRRTDDNNTRVSTTAAAAGAHTRSTSTSSSTRLEREMSLLRRKLDACLQLSALDDDDDAVDVDVSGIRGRDRR